MDRCPRYIPPVVEYESTLRPELFPAAVKLYEEQKYEESFRTLLDHLNSAAARKGEVEPRRWVLPHGSLVVDIRITPEGILEITAPFVKLPAERRAPLLRQAFELNTFNLALSRLVLRDEGLTFEFRTPLELAQPGKISGVLHEICFQGDSRDDEFVSKFGAKPLREKQVTALPKEQTDRAWEIFQEVLAEARRYGDHYAAKRQHGFHFEILGIGLLRLDHALAPQGYLRTRLERSFGQVWQKRPPEEIAAALTRDIDEFRALERSAFDADFYRSDFFVGAKSTSGLQAFQKNMSTRWSWAQDDRAHRNGEGVAFCYLFAAYNLLYTYFVPPPLRGELLGTLEAMGGKGWEEAGELAWTNFQKIMDPAFS